MVGQHDSNRSQVKPKSQLRKHYFLDRYVVIAPRRNQRPRQLDGNIVSHKAARHHPIEENESIYEVADDSGSWTVKVVANKYPALTEDNDDALGVQEVVLETPRVGKAFGQLSVDEIENVLRTYQNRVYMLRQRYAYVSVFKNQGWRSGASLAHTHSQIIATDFTPPDVLTERQALTEYQFKHQTSALCDIVRWELEQEQRAIAHTRYTTTIAPYASRFPLETWIIPNRQAHSIVDLSEPELRSLADHLKGITLALTDNGIDFNYHLQEGIADEYNHFYIKIIPRFTTLAGFELNTGVHINPVSPEYARKWYQRHVKTPDVV